MPRLRPFFASDRKAIDEAMAPLKSFGFRTVHDIKLVTGKTDHAIVGPSGVYSLVTQHSAMTRGAAKKKSVEHATLLRRQLAAGGVEWKVVPVIVLIWDSSPKGITETKKLSIVDIGTLAHWVKGRPLRLEPLELDAALSAITPTTGYFT